jgi:OmpA-OmpF porin, OOP family
MEILGLIKDKLNETISEKISGFLGENPDKIGIALQSAVPTVLGGIMQAAQDETGTQKIMDIIKDGGHTGEVLDDLSGLLNNFDKTQLLITIGSNIFNHFFGNKNSTVVDKLSSLSGIRKTSASSLLGLSAPLVLGALGKIVDKEGLGVSGLMKLLNDQKDTVLGSLPPVIANQLTVKPSKKNGNGNGNHSNGATKVQENNITVTEKKSNFNFWIPVALLALLGLALLAYLWNTKIRNKKTTTDKDSVAAVSVMPDAPKDSSSFYTEKTEAKDTKTTDNQSNNELKPLPKEEEKPIEQPKEEKKTEPVKTDNSFSENTSSNTSSGGSFSDNLKSGNSWISLSDIRFKRNSAEISKGGEIDQIAKYLKANRKAKISIAGGSENSSTIAPDRAWAVYGMLLDKGVRDSQIDVKESRVSGGNSADVVIKVLKR